MDLIEAIFDDYSGDALELLDDPDYDVNYIDDKGQTAFIYACDKKMGEVAMKIVSFDSLNYNYVVDKGYQKSTYLIDAIDNGPHDDIFYDVAIALLNKPNIDYNRANWHGDTPLMSLCMGGDKRTEIALMILDKPDVDYNSESMSSETALIMACHYKMDKVALKILESHNVEYNNRDRWSFTALIYACQNGMEEVALRLLELPKINVEHKSPEKYGGRTALNFAKREKMEAVIERITELTNSK
jgi:ankyrin repeat protein